MVYIFNVSKRRGITRRLFTQLFKQTKTKVKHVFDEILYPTHQISEPLMSQLMADHRRDVLLTAGGGFPRPVEEGGLPVGDQAPVLHGAGGEVGEGDHVLDKSSRKQYGTSL